MKIKPVLLNPAAARPPRIVASHKHVSHSVVKIGNRRFDDTKKMYIARKIESNNKQRISAITDDVYKTQLYQAMSSAVEGKTPEETMDMMDSMVSTVDGANKIVGKQNRGYPARERAMRIMKGVLKIAFDDAKDVLTKTVAQVLKVFLEEIGDIIGKLVKLLLNVVVNVAAEVIKYLIFGFVGGPWATIIPTILNILGPILAVLSPIVKKGYDLIGKVGVKAVVKVGEWLQRADEAFIEDNVIQGVAWLYQWLRNLGAPISDSLNNYFLRFINKF